MSTDEQVLEQHVVHHYESSEDMPEELQKYWHQRYDIWSLYDQDIWMTNDAWFGVTPEPIANSIAKHISESCPPRKKVIIDAFAGVGGNAIAFARSGRWDQIFAIEKDAQTMKCGKHNAEVYGVSGQIVWINGDSFEMLKKRLRSLSGDETVVFGSPPWGGPAYTGDDIFNLSTMQPYSLKSLYDAYSAFTADFVLYLPRSSDLNQIARYASPDKDRKLEVTHYCMSGWSKAICVFFGTWDFYGEEVEAIE